MSRGPDGHFQSDAVLRDAAVDPAADDFPGVFRAGNGADPHGPTVRCAEVGSDLYERAAVVQRQLTVDGLTWADRPTDWATT